MGNYKNKNNNNNNSNNNNNDTQWKKVTKCPRCNGMRYIIVSKSTPETQALYNSDVKIDFGVPCPVCNGGHEEIAENNRQKARIPSAYYDKKMSDFDWDIYGEDVSVTKNNINKYLDKFLKAEEKGTGLYITSKTKGSGKTMLASCICNELITRYRVVTKFVSCSELINIEKYGIHDKEFINQYDNDPIKYLCDCRVLVLDDLGVKKAGQNWNEDILFRILDTRMNTKRITIITSNLAINELNIDERIIDRIFSTSVTIRLPEKAIRQSKAISDNSDFWDSL